MVSEELHAMIPDYVRGLLSAGEAKEVEATLEGSPEIYPEFEAAQTYYAALNQIPEVKAPTGFLDRVNRRIDRVPFWSRVRELLFEPLAVKLPFEMAGVAVCLVTVLILFNPFSSRVYREKERPVAAAVRKKAAEAERPPAPLSTALPAAEKPAEAVAPEEPAATAMPMPEPPAPLSPSKPSEQAAGATGQPQAKAETRPSAGADEATVRAQPFAAASKKAPAPGKKAPARVKKSESAETYARAAAPAPAAPPAEAAPRRAVIGKLDAIPTLPSATTAAPVARAAAAPAAPAMEEDAGETAPRAADAAPKAPASRPAAHAEDIGTIDLTPEEGSLSQTTVETVENILYSTAVTCTRTLKEGKTAFRCRLPPDRLDLLTESLARSFTVTTRLYPYDASVTKMVIVTFVLQ